MYELGNHRLFYQAKEKISVTVIIRTPDLGVTGPFDMIFVDDKLYYFDIVFRQLGSHVFDIYENGVKRHRDILVVSGGNLVIYPKE